MKPENLLMVGNHVKVADFGLLKDLQRVALVRRRADGDLLSAGSAQRTAQRTQRPIQSCHRLPGNADGAVAVRRTDRRAVGRPASAQSADAGRLASRGPAGCGAGPLQESGPEISELPDLRGHLDRTRRLPVAFRSPCPAGRSPFDAARPFGEDRAAQRAGFVRGEWKRCRGRHRREGRRPSEVRNLPRIDLATADQRRRPAIFVGVGGTGGRILSQLQHRLHEAYGNGENVPAVQMLLLDTDSKDLSSLIFKRGERFDSRSKYLSDSAAGAERLPLRLQADLGMAQPPVAV